ncbi:MAG TPA: fumarylacetoacetate hydrolase family protein [Kiritimatiellia bacterium]|jgi:2,4-diketo-3-deoxy-L-fuconate hydrolase|nr:fumarylacetoacetate hydrolase family protein [Lentisphaerota bacterium]HRV31362.1 fumarylacetoacetate hydrolase family protein [Kiritimatiellia bacterium]
MKLVRYGAPGAERPGLWLDATASEPARILDVRGMAFDMDDYDARFWRTFGLDRLRGLLLEKKLKTIPAEGVRLGPPIARPRQIICLDRNFRDHAQEMKMDTPVSEFPGYFLKSPGALCGPYDSILLRPGMDCVDAEVELAVVIGRRARDVQEADAWSYVGGLTIMNDVSNRDLQKARPHNFFAKSADTFGPLGPWLVTCDEIPQPYALTMQQRLNGDVLQKSSTAHMIFRVEVVLADLTRVMTLEPGDVISMGTPGGIGSAHHPPRLLRDGDVVECAIDALGAQRNSVAMSGG